MNDRIPTKPGRVKLTKDDGSVFYAVIERADEPTVEGTPLNKATLMNDVIGERYGLLPEDTVNNMFERSVQEITVDIPVAGWSTAMDADGWYTNRVEIPEMKSVYNPIMDLVISTGDASFSESADYSAIQIVETFDGYAIFKANRTILEELRVVFKGV